MADPLVSILLPVRNAGAMFTACLRSIVRQREPRWECVVVDDGSTDGSLDVARRFAARDERFVAIAAGHRGLVATLEAGLARCRGRFVARMDADDLMHRDRLAAQLGAFDAEPDLSAVGCRVRLFPRGALRAGWRAYERWLNGIAGSAAVRAEAFVECPLAHPTLMVRRAVLGAFGYRDRGWPEDYDLVLRLLAAGHPLDVVPRRLVSWRHHAARLTCTAPAYARERLTALKAHFIATTLLASTDTYVLWGHGATGRALRRALLAHGKRPSHVVEVSTRRIGNTIHGAPVVSHEALASLPRAPVVASVAGEVPRRLIRAALKGLGLVETRDFVCAA